MRLHIAGLIWISVYKLFLFPISLKSIFHVLLRSRTYKGESCCRSCLKRLKDGEQLLVGLGPITGNPQRTLKT